MRHKAAHWFAIYSASIFLSVVFLAECFLLFYFFKFSQNNFTKKRLGSIICDQTKKQNPMGLKTILNEYVDFQSFVLGECQFERSKSSIEIQLHPRKNSKSECGLCEIQGSCKDHLPSVGFNLFPFGVLKHFPFSQWVVKIVAVVELKLKKCHGVT